jgi:hypothetical protein
MNFEEWWAKSFVFESELASDLLVKLGHKEMARIAWANAEHQSYRANEDRHKWSNDSAKELASEVLVVLEGLDWKEESMHVYNYHKLDDLMKRLKGVITYV